MAGNYHALNLPILIVYQISNQMEVEKVLTKVKSMHAPDYFRRNLFGPGHTSISLEITCQYAKRTNAYVSVISAPACISP